MKRKIASGTVADLNVLFNDVLRMLPRIIMPTLTTAMMTIVMMMMMMMMT